MDKTLSICTIVFKDDLSLLELQIKSLLKFCNTSNFVNYMIVINDDDLNTNFIREQLIKALSHTWLEKITQILTVNQIFKDSNLNRVSGWRSQQALKLELYKFVEARYCLILDAKNHLISNFDPDKFFDSQNRILTNFRVKHGSQAEWLSDSLSLLEIKDVDLNTFLSPPTTTPYLMDIYETREMSITLLKKHKNWLDFFKISETKETEFFLYASWIYKKYGSFDTHFFSSKDDNSVTFFGRYPSDPNDILSVLKKLSKGKVVFFGFHRARIKYVMTKDLPYSDIRNCWIKSGLFKDEKDIEMHFFGTDILE